MKPYFPNPDEPFLFPVSWFLVFGICLFLTLYYPVYDRDTFGKWSSYIPAAAQSGGRPNVPGLSLQPSFTFPVLDPPPHQLPAVRRSIYPFCFPLYERYFLLRETVPPDQWNVCHVLLLMPPLIASSFGILQMLLTLWFRPIICF